jgi:hypothetical protein
MGLRPAKSHEKSGAGTFACRAGNRAGAWRCIPYLAPLAADFSTLSSGEAGWRLSCPQGRKPTLLPHAARITFMRSPLLLLLCATALSQPNPKLTLSYLHPAEDWQTQALPIGNGRLGAMIFGDPQHEHLQLNEISLWTGNEKDTGRYQNLADLTLDLDHGPAEPASYRRQLSLSDAIHSIDYAAGHTRYHREYFASFPSQVLVFEFTADRPGAYSGTLKLTDAHKAPTTAAAAPPNHSLTATGKLDNGLNYETQVWILNEGGSVRAGDGALRIEKADALTLIVGAGTDYVPDRAKSWRTDLPHDRITRQLRAAPPSGSRISARRMWRTIRHFSTASRSASGDHPKTRSRVPPMNASSPTPKALPIPNSKPCSSNSAAIF